MTEIANCRFCGDTFFAGAILEYPGSPQSAQGFLENLETPDDVVDLKIYQCHSCGLVQHNQPPVNYYRDVIRAVAFSEEMGNFRNLQLSKFIENFDLTGKPVLEIGCGRGEYLELLKLSGSNVVSGLENSIDSVESARQRGFDVKQGYLSSAMSNPWPFGFDAFVIFSFMEHWPNLQDSLGGLKKLLNNGAIGLIEVPNFDFIIANGLYSEFSTDHIFYFDKKTLQTTLELNGFDVLNVESIWHDYILSAQVRKRNLIDTANFTSKQAAILDQLNNFVERFDPTDVVIWGAGHQALAVMSLGRLQTKVSHVIDSASFKQNKYTPGTRLLIKEPDSLLQDLPKAIVIMAAAYSDEVVRTIIQRYRAVRHLAILRADRVEVIELAI